LGESPPHRIGPYLVERELGRGGMGVVYLARDPKLGRAVAVKVLPPETARDPERIARLEREARAMAALNHPNIATLHALEADGAVRFLVMECVEGDTLAERLAAGRINAHEAIRVAAQIAGAVEAAHEAGIVHRDLKPGNVKIRTDGGVKVLDFGLAKAGGSFRDAISDIETVPFARTTPGAIIGTVAYMSPEQARGLDVDGRTDIWALGCILFECLTGRMPFAAETSTDVLARVIGSEPDWALLGDECPPSVVELLHRCLVKDRSRRQRDAMDVRIRLEDAAAAMRGTLRIRSGAPLSVGKGPSARKTPRAKPQSRAAPGSRTRAATGESAALRVQVAVPDGQQLFVAVLGVIGISRDGRKIAYSTGRGRSAGIVLRSLDRFENTLLPGTEGGTSPFFSPDGTWIAFFTGANLCKIPVEGGAVTKLAPCRGARGGVWLDDDTIVYVPEWSAGLWSVPAAGGQTRCRFAPDVGKGEVSFLYPHSTPDQRTLIFTVATTGISSMDEASIAAQPLAGGEHRVLLRGGMGGRLTASGHLVYGWNGEIMAAPIDPERLEITGPVRKVIPGVTTEPFGGNCYFDVSRNGTLVFAAGASRVRNVRLAWLDRAGRVEPVNAEPKPIRGVRLSADGHRALAVHHAAHDRIWINDLRRGTQIRLTDGPGNDMQPIWSPDGRSVVFSSDTGLGVVNLMTIPSDRSAPARLLVKSDLDQAAVGWMHDGSLVLLERDPETGWRACTLAPGATATTRLPIEPLSQRYARVSPNSRSFAFSTRESARHEVAVCGLPDPGPRLHVSFDGGDYPEWSPNGTELFYISGRRLMSVPVQYGEQDQLVLGEARCLVESDVFESEFRQYSVAPDASRFLIMIETDPAPEVRHLNLVLNWFDELRG